MNEGAHTELRALLEALVGGKVPPEGRFKDWQITPVSGGANNRLYHAHGPTGDLAIKFAIRDKRHRANREHAALQALYEAGLGIAPRPVLLDINRYGHPVVVQEWLPGLVSPHPPADDEGWNALLDHYLAIHSITPGNSAIWLNRAVFNFASARQAVQAVNRMASWLPISARPGELGALVQRLGSTRLPSWRKPGLALCRTDPAPLNFIRRQGGWASVDWENSGWGDPAFEIADLLAHPAYLDVPPERREWVISRYCHGALDPEAEVRIRTDFRILQVFWVVRLARYLNEVPRGQDERLVDRPPGWEADIRRKYERYVKRAEAGLEEG